MVVFRRILVRGIVQSVGFRPFIRRIASDLDTKGFVRNLGNGDVEIVIEDHVEKEFIHRMLKELPELSAIYEMSSDYYDGTVPDGFQILPSDISLQSSFAPLPPDISICDQCIEDLYKGRRTDYEFISCTNCGPRYSVIRSLPYDRDRTSFEKFPLCNECFKEYRDMNNRRFHAQTICCRKCGPSYSLFGDKGQPMPLDWQDLASQINKGSILFMQGQSGSHFICNATNETALKRLRKIKRHESRKPFAVMARSASVLEDYAKITSVDELKLLLSPRKPIVVLPAKKESLPIDLIAPGLDTVGFVLPYTSAQHLLFKKGLADLVVLTSANKPGIPMPIKPFFPVLDPEYYNSEYYDLYFQNMNYYNAHYYNVDYYLLHNLPIEQRVDDSVVKPLGVEALIIRRARGYVPQPHFHKELRGGVLGLGANEVVTASISTKNWIVATQHIGNLNNIETLNFLEDAVNHLMNLYSINPDHVAVDLHPEFLNRKLLSNFPDATIHEIQHHEAHAYSLLVDHGLPFDTDAIIWTVDGFGYGHDGNAWGTELFLLSSESPRRIASGLPIPYFGGDMNAKHPARMFLSILLQTGLNPDDYILDYSAFPHGETEYHFLRRKFTGSPVTTSIARLLDAAAFYLAGVDKRTYRGEPAIRLEALAGRNGLQQTPSYIKGNCIDTPKILHDMLVNYSSKTESARFVHDAIASTMAELAIEAAETHGIKTIGFTGGVAYNYRIHTLLKQIVKANGYHFLAHKTIPPGDGGISYGQVALVERKLR